MAATTRPFPSCRSTPTANSTIKLDTAVNLSQWKATDYGFPVGVLGNWQLENGGAAVQQTLNGGTTFYVSNSDFINSDFAARLRVDSSAGDNDYIGLVFGFQTDPTDAQPNNYYLLSWKQASEGNAASGLKLAKVTNTGIPGNRPDLWDLGTPDPHVQILAQGPTAGWQADTDYDFHLNYQSDGAIALTVLRANTGEVVWNLQVTDPSPLGAGKVGF